MNTSTLKLGGIYQTQWSQSPCRIIGLDNIEVLYDSLWTHDNTWTFTGNLSKKCAFYRISAKLFANTAKLIDTMPLSDEEMQVFAPHLPLRIGRTRVYNWGQAPEMAYEDFRQIVLSDNEALANETLPASQIILMPYGNKGGLKKGEIVSANNATSLSVIELLWQAKLLQEKTNADISQGIGIYRLGITKRLPSYYIGEYTDRAGLLSEK